MTGAYRAGADAPEETDEVTTPPSGADAAPEPVAGPRARRGRRRRRRPLPPVDLADIADATGVRQGSEAQAPDEPAPPAGEATAPEADAQNVSPETGSAQAAVPEEPSQGPATGDIPAQDRSAGPVADDITEDDEDEGDDEDDIASSVRPYSWTRGRTRTDFELQLETLISTTDHGRDMATLTSIEHRAVAELCSTPRSVAEIAALLELPLGVARVVVGDMTGLELVAVHDGSSGDAPDAALMERVLSGLRRL